MLRKIMTILLPLIAFAGGLAGGELLRPGRTAAVLPDQTSTSTSEDGSGPEPQQSAHDPAETAGPRAWFSFPGQFFVPMMRNGDMGAMMILTLSLETREADLEALKQQEHRLRDALLRALMITANTGGFDGNFTTEARLQPLRETLLKAARQAAGDMVSAVLIEAIARQEGSSS